MFYKGTISDVKNWIVKIKIGNWNNKLRKSCNKQSKQMGNRKEKVHNYRTKSGVIEK